PIVLSVAVLIGWSIGISVSGMPKPEPDEGTTAHLFQIWLVIEVLMIAFFAARWLPQRPKEAFPVLVMQIAGVILGCFPVFLLGL
ncbi:MAG: hypothetical protein WD967_00015, partial [Candidatus Levyibacteriota bacterium]